MTTPTITEVGAAGGLLKIIDHNDVVHRMPKQSICDISDSSNKHAFRLDICHARGDITLLFASAAEITTALSSIDSAY